MAAKQDRKHCWYCGCKLRKPADAGYWPDRKTRDHVIPRSRLARGVPAITVPCCQRCNLAKGDSSLEEFRANTPFPMKDGRFYGEIKRIKTRKIAADRRGFNSLMADRITEAMKEMENATQNQTN